jgi:hypothetical protein
MQVKLFLYTFIVLALMQCWSCKKDKGPDVEPILSVSRSVIEVGNYAEYYDTVKISANVAWTIELPEEAKSWLLVVPWVSPQGDSATVTIKVLKDNHLPAQTATVTIMPVRSDVPAQQFTVTRKQFITEWKKCYGGQVDDQFNAMAVLPNGQIVFSGSSHTGDGDAFGYTGSPKGWILRTGSDGNMIWQKQAVPATGFLHGEYRSVAATGDGGSVSAGYVNINYGFDVSVTRSDADGNVIWNKTFGGTGSDQAYNIISTANGGFLLSGETSSQDGDVKLNHGALDLWVLKLDANGNVMWEKTFGGTDNDMFGKITVCSDGGYLLCGTSKSNNSGDVPVSHGDEDIFIVKLDAAGNKQWTKTYGGALRDGAGSIIGDTDGGCIIAGNTNSSDGDLVGRNKNLNHDMWVLKLNKDGQIVWKTALGGGRQDFASSLVRLPNGNIAIAGSAESSDGDVIGNRGGYDVWVVVLNSRGKMLWQRTFGSYTGDYNEHIGVTADGSLLVANLTDGNELDVSGSHGRFEAWVFKLK